MNNISLEAHIWKNISDGNNLKTSSAQLGSAQISSALSQYSLELSPDPYQIRRTPKKFSSWVWVLIRFIFCQKSVLYSIWPREAQPSNSILIQICLTQKSLESFHCYHTIDSLIIKILASFSDFEGAKNIHFLYVQIWGFGGEWRFLIGVLNFDPDLYMVTGLWYTQVPNFGPLPWFWSC